MKRRDFLKTTASAAVLAGLPLRARAQEPAAEQASKKTLPEATARRLPRWRGFNLLEKFMLPSGNGPFVEADFEWIAEWGFDFVRLPMDYRCWTDPDDPYRLDEKTLREIDQAVALGEKHTVHVNLNLHRAPGYTVAKPAEKLNLWKDEEAQKQFDFQWSGFAKRYQGIPSNRLSFDLVNEPAGIDAPSYARVAGRAVAAIRQQDPDRLVICDGRDWGRTPVPELVELGVAQSTRGYDPSELTHYKASWVWHPGKWVEPTWPLARGETRIDRDWLKRDRIEPWKQLEAKGVGVHVGEWGVFNQTPHAVTLAWMRDNLSLWQEAGWGWALWNLRGSIGILDSGRADVQYEPFRGHQLDRKMLDLLRQF
ncbi:MAG: cellulase family glycosylhydrolase [Planctomycetia bacterium]|nr:cellulase family glycosylhydrolase [Planctomycetia bacterium]